MAKKEKLKFPSPSLPRPEVESFRHPNDGAVHADFNLPPNLMDTPNHRSLFAFLRPSLEGAQLKVFISLLAVATIAAGQALYLGN